MLKHELNLMPTEIAICQNLVVCLILSNSKFRKLQITKIFQNFAVYYVMILYGMICLYSSVSHFVNTHMPISRHLMKSEFLSVYHFFNARKAFIVFPKVDEHIGRSIDDHQQGWYVVRELWKWQLSNRIFWHNF